jgi:hypothetical protein
VAAAGTNRTLALQAEWDARSLYGVQSRVLGQILRLAPEVKPNTLIVLLGGAEAFPATFTFRHAIRYFYAGHALGHVWSGHELFYPARIGPDGIDIEPWPRIQGPWSAPATRHAYEEIVVVSVDLAGAVSVEPRWPERLPAFPGQAHYAPEGRIVPAPPANPRAVLLAAGRVDVTEPRADGRATIHAAWHSSRAHSGP